MNNASQAARLTPGCFFSPERSLRIFRYSKISPDIYQYWAGQEKSTPYFSGKVRADIPIFQNLPRYLPVLGGTGKKHAVFLRKGPCGYSDIPKSLLVLPAAPPQRARLCAPDRADCRISTFLNGFSTMPRAVWAISRAFPEPGGFPRKDIINYSAE